MTDHQLTMLKIKSDLMDLWTKDTALQSYEQWFKALKLKLNNHFHIAEADYFIYANNSFVPLKGHKSVSKRKEALVFDALKMGKAFSRDSLISRVKENGFNYADDFLLFQNLKSEPLGLLVLKSTDEWRAFAATPFLHELEKVVSDIIEIVREMVFLVKEKKSSRRLFGVTELFNSTMQSNVILDGVVSAISKNFPSSEVGLLLSHDQNGMTHNYKLLDYMNERQSAMNAFVSGELTREVMPELSCTLINAPIRGRQGIYGVLQIKAPVDLVFSSTQKKFVSMVVNTAGSALEKAILHDQSHRVIEDLQLVNETSKKLNSNMHFGEMTAFLKQQLLKAFRPTEIAFVFNNEQDGYDISQLSSDFFRTESGKNYIEFASNHLRSGKEALFDANFSGTMNEPIGYESIIAIPIMNQELLTGFVVLLHMDQYYFSFDSFKLIQSLIGHSSLALANSVLRDQLQELVDKDHLTKLFTRSYVDKIIEKSIVDDEMGVFVLVDVDDFKKVNDTYGHVTGDDVLKQIASTILSEVSGRGVAGRWGGEEIAIFLPLTGFQEGALFAERLVKLIPDTTEPSITVSIGMHNWTSKRQSTYKELFQRTDKALYMAKNNGKNQVVIHEKTSCIFS
ncbi:GGDEF domain-containing protein [Sporosarcina sp. E16_3]|uniref:diguanylate cyclase domain-containing protein n=1 Tax=Sporosarcina sp. E16_3 TaxID=2789293 RepID=UPI001A928367|nr:GGDEF domain-containing protein [Sporosarcina sp. E16_3]